MDSAEPNSLIDFLYRDHNRILSLYAQLFGGLPSTIEVSASSRESSDKAASGSVYVVKGEYKSTIEHNTGKKEISTPHDVISTDVINMLISRKFVTDQIDKAIGGTFIKAVGQLHFTDGNTMSLFSKMVDEVTGMTKQKSKRVLELMRSTHIASMFFLEVDRIVTLTGTVKETGLEEPIANFFFKHGDKGHDNIEVIAIKEMSSALRENSKSMFGFHSGEFYNALRDILIPKDAVAVTPIAIYRRSMPLVSV